MLEAMLNIYLAGIAIVLIAYLVHPGEQKKVEMLFDSYNYPEWLRILVILFVAVMWPIWVIEAILKEWA